MCPQPGFNKPPDEALWDEDCLQLNVWMPAGDRPEKGENRCALTFIVSKIKNFHVNRD